MFPNLKVIKRIMTPDQTLTVILFIAAFLLAMLILCEPFFRCLLVICKLLAGAEESPSPSEDELIPADVLFPPPYSVAASSPPDEDDPPPPYTEN